MRTKHGMIHTPLIIRTPSACSLFAAKGITDSATGSGLNGFRHDMLTQGPQVGFTFHF